MNLFSFFYMIFIFSLMAHKGLKSEYRKCVKDNDCVFLASDGCCNASAINKLYLNDYLKKHKNAHVDEFCLLSENTDKKLTPLCLNSICKLQESTIDSQD